MTVDLDQVRHVAALARLGMPEERLAVLARELSGILDHMAVLQRVDTQAVREAAAHPTPLRADHGPPIALMRPPETFAPEMRDGFFIVPRLATHGGRSAEDDAGGSSEGAGPGTASSAGAQ